MRIAVRLVLGFVCLTAGAIQAPGQSTEQTAASKKTQGESQQQPPDAAQEKITAVPNRPTFASTAEMVQRGVFEIEYGFEAADGHQNINGLLKWGAVKISSCGFSTIRLSGTRLWPGWAIPARASSTKYSRKRRPGRLFRFCMLRHFPRQRQAWEQELPAIRCNCSSARTSASITLTSTKECSLWADPGRAGLTATISPLCLTSTRLRRNGDTRPRSRGLAEQMGRRPQP